MSILQLAKIQLALLVVGGLIQNYDFQQDLELARQELIKKGLLKRSFTNL